MQPEGLPPEPAFIEGLKRLTEWVHTYLGDVKDPKQLKELYFEISQGDKPFTALEISPQQVDLLVSGTGIDAILPAGSVVQLTDDLVNYKVVTQEAPIKLQGKTPYLRETSFMLHPNGPPYIRVPFRIKTK